MNINWTFQIDGVNRWGLVLNILLLFVAVCDEESLRELSLLSWVMTVKTQSSSILALSIVYAFGMSWSCAMSWSLKTWTGWHECLDPSLIDQEIDAGVARKMIARQDLVKSWLSNIESDKLKREAWRLQRSSSSSSSNSSSSRVTGSSKMEWPSNCTNRSTDQHEN